MRVKASVLATLIKASDLTHNMSDLAPGPKLEKYQLAYYILTHDYEE